MRRRTVLMLIPAALLAPFAARAQQRLPRIAVLFGGVIQAPVLAAFWDELIRLGWVDGRTAMIEVRDAQGDLTRVPALARETVARNPDVIISTSSAVHVALKELTRTIPVVVAVTTDPVALGLTESLSRPSANFTGFTGAWDDIMAKRLELLRRIMPEARRVALFLNPTNPAFPRALALARAAAAPLQWEVLVAGFESAETVLPAVDAARAAGADALVVQPDPLAIAQQRAIVARTIELRLPAIFNDREDLSNGVLLVYGLDRAEIFRQVAGYVDRLLRGAKVADLPFIAPSRLVLGVNLQTAAALGLTIPPDIVARADEVIE